MSVAMEFMQELKRNIMIRLVKKLKLFYFLQKYFKFWSQELLYLFSKSNRILTTSSIGDFFLKENCYNDRFQF